MAGVNVDTALMQTTAMRSRNIGDNMATQARTLKAGLDFVTQKWQGQAGDAFRTSMGGQGLVLDRLVQRLLDLADIINRGGQGLASQDSSARSNLQGQGENFLNAPLNH